MRHGRCSTPGMKKLILAAVVLALSSGAAVAGHGHGGGYGGGHGGGRGGGWRGGGWRGGGAQGGAVVHTSGDYRGTGGYRGDGGSYRGGRATVVLNGGYRGGYAVPRNYHTHGVVRSNIWLEPPVIRDHYYRYDYRPSLYVESYGPREGYIFVRGDWQWDGYEWIWQAGHYEPDGAYVEVY